MVENDCFPNSSNPIAFACLPDTRRSHNIYHYSFFISFLASSLLREKGGGVFFAGRIANEWLVSDCLLSSYCPCSLCFPCFPCFPCATITAMVWYQALLRRTWKNCCISAAHSSWSTPAVTCVFGCSTPWVQVV